MLPTSYTWIVTQTGGGGGRGGPVGLSGNRGIVGKRAIAVPVSGDGRGRLSLVSGEDQLRKMIMLNLQDLESSNPFQGDIGMGGDMLLTNNTEAIQPELKRRINSLFRRLQLEDRARLAKAVSFKIVPETQELEAFVGYVNLEENKPAEVSLLFSTTRSGDVARSLTTALKGP